ncbi:MAG: dipeptide ABC transporter ATP-binding protein [Dehalococcoidia bacterium]|nr:dipeptide ABC transporter ATP-binding protein [Dehalococcoidia bacterium]MSQ16120.1 dipeptide ABC transporter ATP-binding protein [Dehalococcoidia bacterium]
MSQNGAATSAVISVENAQKYFPVSKGVVVRTTIGHVKAVDGVSFEIKQGETFSLVGESGCGKTTTARMILQVEKPTAGIIKFQGNDLATLRSEQYREYRASVQAVFQDPWSSLNPRMRVGSIIMEPLLTNRKLSKGEAKEKLESLLEEVGLHSFQGDYYPHEFSGGQRQRIAIARALSLQPKLIVLDEPVSALDVSIRAQIMNLLRDLQERYGVAYLLIAHNLATVRYMSHNVGVMYLGKIVETAPTHELFTNPMHPYTKALISAALPSHPDIQREDIVLSGEIPSPLNPPSGCAFHPRCPFVLDRCSKELPVLKELKPQHEVSCHLY